MPFHLNPHDLVPIEDCITVGDWFVLGWWLIGDRWLVGLGIAFIEWVFLGLMGGLLGFVYRGGGVVDCSVGAHTGCWCWQSGVVVFAHQLVC